MWVQKIDGAYMCMIANQHEGHGATRRAAIANAKKSQRSESEDSNLARAEEKMIDKMVCEGAKK